MPTKKINSQNPPPTLHTKLKKQCTQRRNNLEAICQRSRSRILTSRKCRYKNPPTIAAARKDRKEHVATPKETNNQILSQNKKKKKKKKKTAIGNDL